LMMSLWDALRMNMMISYQELVRTFPNWPCCSEYRNSNCHNGCHWRSFDNKETRKDIYVCCHYDSVHSCASYKTILL
ncbi:hypothetical protein C4Y86_025295, partial [Klebsiella pneumoniae subsp. pneumoniae]